MNLAARTLVRSQYSCSVLCRNVLPVQSVSVQQFCTQTASFLNNAQYKSDVLSVLSPSLINLQPARQTRGVCTGRTNRMPVSAYSAVQRGKGNTDSYKVFIEDDSGPISPFHDIPLVANEQPRTFHVVIEIPRWTNAKMEIDTKSKLNPIVQDEKKGKLRFVANSFPHHGYIWNYGAFPQTWENPHHTDHNTGEKGDNDPVDICEIGGRVAKRGDVLEVKVLGILAMVDDGETDWKVIVIDVTDPLADKLNSLKDVESEMPGFLDATREWFRIYKMPDGKPENKFAFDGEFKDASFAHKIIEETHVFWRQLVGLSSPSVDGGKLDTSCVTVQGAANILSREEANQIFQQTQEYEDGEALDCSLDTWHYTHLK